MTATINRRPSRPRTRPRPRRGVGRRAAIAAVDRRSRRFPDWRVRLLGFLAVACFLRSVLRRGHDGLDLGEAKDQRLRRRSPEGVAVDRDDDDGDGDGARFIVGSDGKGDTAWERGDFSAGAFVVAGVDLARFSVAAADGRAAEGVGGANTSRHDPAAAAAAVEATPPFRLHTDFDLGGTTGRIPLRRGHRGGWDDLVALRRKESTRPDLRFYVDKVAQKRWLPRSGLMKEGVGGDGGSGGGVDIPRPIALRYASELTENRSRDAGERSRAILDLLPDLIGGEAAAAAGYAAKPSHQTYCDGVRLLAYDRDAGAVLLARNSEDLEPIVNGTGSDVAVREDVARRLGKYLDLGPRGKGLGSAALQGVAPGVVVEERFLALDEGESGGGGGENRKNKPAMEFKVYCVWGRVVFAAWQRGTATPMGTVRRDGAVLEAAKSSGAGGRGAGAREAILPDWVDWDRVVALAEALATRKDMYRVDIFAGVPAGSAAASDPDTAMMPEKDRRAAVRYVVSETEIAPSGSEVDDKSALAEAARLWLAGYTIGNFETRSNDEVPRYFHKNGVMPENPIEFSVPEFLVAGVDLAAYGRKEGNIRAKVVDGSGSNASQFELFEDFDISDMITGDEGWYDLTAYRKELRRPSLGFYMDKICQKRWLPTIGVDTPGALLLRYGRELSPERVPEEESAAMLRLLPTDRDYAAKPSHSSYSDGVRLVRHHPVTGRMAMSANRKRLVPVPLGEEARWRNETALRLAEYLHVRAREDDSWTLHNVEPGVVVEERFTLWDGDDSAPAVEFKVFVVWGRVVFALWRRGLSRPGIVRRDGTLADWSEKSESVLPAWLEWGRVVEVSERLAARKDMYRVDVFVGVAAGSPSLRPGVSETERIASVRYAVSETEIYPTTSVDEEVFAEAARLWIAGYKLRNFRVVKNSEVESVFLKKGFMPMKDSVS